mgnify:CR=1 FL=1
MHVELLREVAVRVRVQLRNHHVRLLLEGVRQLHVCGRQVLAVAAPLAVRENKQGNEKTYIGGLTKKCVDAFVSMVYLYDDQTMKVEFNCEDVIRRALEKYGA